ncbi:MAG: acyl-CoA synthetase [Spongiibacteraceae bacterium]|jgi:long-chain acyl-CoA synthetase|nr:acyl-CoA synthetase [Spongiibacteraceae bacterium]
MANLGFWHLAQQNGDALALVDPCGRELSRAQLLSEANRIVHGLRALGLGTGDVVAIIAPNCWEFIATNLAVTQAGLYMVPINWHLTGPEIAYILEDSGAKAFIVHEKVAEAALAAKQQAKFPDSGAFAIGRVDGFRPFAALGEGQPDTLPEGRTAGAVMNYTSGTTGKPKGVRRPLSGLDPETAHELYAMMQMMFGIQPGADNVHFCGSPLYHTAVLVWASTALHMGHAVVLVDKWDPEGMLQLIEKYRVTTSHMVPTQFTRLLKLPEEVRSRYDVSSLRNMIHAAAPCPPDIKRAMLAWWGPTIYEYYAATEGGGTLCTPQDWLENPGTVGKAWPTADIRILDDEGNELPAGEKGMVYMLMAQNARFEYRGDQKKTAENRRGDYFTVGDIGYLNERGFLFLCDRKIDMIISGGANIYPAEIENALILHDKVADCAVFGIPNDDWGEEIKAVVQPAEGVEAGEALTAELMAFLQSQLAKMKWPRSIDYLPELPRDPNGKLYKRRLRDPYWQSRERQV